MSTHFRKHLAHLIIRDLSETACEPSNLPASCSHAGPAACLPYWLQAACLLGCVPSCFPAKQAASRVAYLPIQLPCYLLACLPTCLFACPAGRLLGWLAGCLRGCLPAWLPVCLPAYLPACADHGLTVRKEQVICPLDWKMIGMTACMVQSRLAHRFSGYGLLQLARQKISACTHEI